MGYYEKLDTIEEARRAARVLLADDAILKIYIYEGGNLVETLESPFSENMSSFGKEYDLVYARCFLPDSLFVWADYVKRSSIMNGRLVIEEFEFEERKDTRPERDLHVVNCYYAPAVVYECHVLKDCFVRLILKRKIWEDNQGNKVMSPYKVELDGFVRSYLLSEKDVYDIGSDEPRVAATSGNGEDGMSVKDNNRKKNKSEGMFSTTDVYADENYSFKSKNLADKIERESWLDELDRSEKDDPWD